MSDHDDQQTNDVDPRHQKRIKQMQALFAYAFLTPSELAKQELSSEHQALVADIIPQLAEIDALISAQAPERPLSEINRVDLAILRLILFESRRKKTPKKVLLNEAVELAKEFGSASSSKFVNGVLAKIIVPETEHE